MVHCVFVYFNRLVHTTSNSRYLQAKICEVVLKCVKSTKVMHTVNFQLELVNQSRASLSLKQNFVSLNCRRRIGEAPANLSICEDLQH